MASAVELVPQLSPFVRQWENFNPNAYADGTQTSIGYGTRAQPGETTITREEAERRMQAELTAAAQYVDSIPGIDRLTDDQKKALTDQAYNAGGFGTGLKQAIASGSPQDVAYWMSQYRGTSQPGTEQGVSNRVDARLQLAQGDGSQPTQVATATPPPMPNLRPTLATASSNYPVNDFGGVTPQLASYNTSTPQAPAQPFVDNLGGNGTSSPLHQYNVYEPSNVSAGPYGADKLVQAAISGDVNAFNKALGDLTGAAARDALMPKALGGIGMDGVQQKLQGYFDQLQQQSPGAVRAMQTAYNNNPQLAAAVPPQLQGALQDAFKALPAQSTGQVPLPNLRPSNAPASSPQAQTPPPMPIVPTMVSAGLPPKDNAPDPRFPPGWSPGQPLPLDAGDAASWPDNAATNFTLPNYWTPSTLNPSQQMAMGDYTSYVAPPAPSPFDYQPYIKSGQIQFPDYLPPSTPQQPFFGIPASQFQSAFNAMVPPLPQLPAGGPFFGTPASMQAKPTVAPQRPTTGVPMPAAPPPPPMTPQQAFAQQAGPVPQNVNWGAPGPLVPGVTPGTLTQDPYAQPGTDNTYVLNDTGYGGGELGGPGFNAFVYG